MEVEKQLYLIGGSQAFESIAESFLASAGGWNAWIALLLQTNDFSSFRHISEYVTPWAKHGIRGYEAFGPNPNGELELDRLACILEKATGIFIGGGDTAAYRDAYCRDEVEDLIRQRYNSGVPVAGCSAGALVMLDDCVVHLEDGGLEVGQGIGLVGGFVIDVHFTEREGLSKTLAAMAVTDNILAYGIDEGACVLFRNGELSETFGDSVHKVKIHNALLQDYEVTTI